MQVRKPGSREGSKSKQAPREGRKEAFLQNMNASPRNPIRNTGGDHEAGGEGPAQEHQGGFTDVKGISF